MIDKIRFDYVDASLRCGQVFSSRIWKAFITIIYVMLSIVLSICAIYFVVIPITVGKYSSNDLIGVICSCAVSILFLIGVIVFHKVYNSKKRIVESWLEDAVLLEAKAISIGERPVIRNLIAITGVALEVSFRYNDMQYIRRSEREDEKPIYLPVYRKYADKIITIAYSPKYDEVMLIKPGHIDSGAI